MANERGREGDCWQAYLKELHLPAFRASYEELARQAQQEALSYEQYLLESGAAGVPGAAEQADRAAAAASRGCRWRRAGRRWT